MDIYEMFKKDGIDYSIPFFKIQERNTDMEELYKIGSSRMDLISYKFYKTPNYGFIIMMANSEYFSNETDIENDIYIRIPYPLDDVLNELIVKYKEYLNSNTIG